MHDHEKSEYNYSTKTFVPQRVQALVSSPARSRASVLGCLRPSAFFRSDRRKVSSSNEFAAGSDCYSSCMPRYPALASSLSRGSLSVVSSLRPCFSLNFPSSRPFHDLSVPGGLCWPSYPVTSVRFRPN